MATTETASLKSMEYAVEASGLVKNYGDFAALRDVSLKFPTGSTLGILGPNGAGKTTLVRILTTLTRPDQGSAEVMGWDVRRHPGQVKRLIGVTGQYAAVDEHLTAFENLEMIGRLSRLTRKASKTRADELLSQFRLSDTNSKLVGAFSGGMRRRLDLAAALVASPPLVILDEPTTGLDPLSRRELWDAIDNLVGEGTSVLLTTQYLEEADRLADRIAVIDKGKVVARGTPGDLKEGLGGRRLEIRLANSINTRVAGNILEKECGYCTREDEGGLVLSGPVADGLAELAAVSSAMHKCGIAVREMGIRQATLDDVFLKITGRSQSFEGQGGFR